MWSASSPNRQISYGVVPNEIGMMGFRDMFVLAPAATFHYGNNQHYQEPTLSFDTNIPLLSASPYIQNNGMDEGVINGNTHCREIHFQQPAETYNNNNIKKPMIGAINKPTSTSTCITCRDCGNQAKKGCSFKRCRTCCKSRGFDCSTHVKSTWVPAARRRERQLMGSGGGGGDVVVVGSAGSSQSINNSSSSKKPKVAVASQTTAASHASTSNTTPPTSFESGSSHQADHRDVDGKSFATAAAGDGSYNNNSKEPLPGQVRAPAVFKCVRVTAMDDGDDEYAYQATVKIGGHVFKGFLYDQGVADQVVSRDGIPSLSDLHLGGGGGGGRRDGCDESSSPAVQNMLHSSDVYGISGGHLLGGSSTSFIC